MAIVTGVSPEKETDQYRDIKGPGFVPYEELQQSIGDGMSGSSIGVQGNCKVYDSRYVGVPSDFHTVRSDHHEQ